MTFRNLLRMSTAVLTTAMALSLGGRNYAAAADGSGMPLANNQIQQVVVTALRRTENLQKVPVAASVLSGGELQKQGITTVQDLQKNVPGLSIQPAASSETFINIRGVGLQQTNPASSNGVAFYVDGQYVPTLIDTVDTFYDLASVEVLRGPQGTLVGSNSDGGAIFVNSAQPTLDRTKGYIQQTFGNYSDFRTEGAVNVPVTDELAVRLAFVRETRDSFTKNIGNPTGGQMPQSPNQPGNVNFSAVRLQALYQPSADFSATVRVEPYQSRTDGYANKPDMSSISPANPGYDPYAAKIQNQPFKIDYNTPQYWNITGQRSGLTLKWNGLGFAQVKSITSYQTGSESDMGDVDASSSPGSFTQVRRSTYTTLTQELDLISTQQSPLQWVTGLYYLSEQAPLQLTFSDPAPFHSVSLNLVSKHETIGIFGSATYKITPDLALSVGLRGSHDNLPFQEKICTGFPQPCGNYSTSDSEFNYSAKLNWQIAPSSMAYLSVSTGYKAGGINLQIPDIGFTPPPFRPETNTVYELGAKTTLLDRHLQIDADVFDSQYKNYQLQEFLGGLPATQGPGSATILGAEAQVKARMGGFTADLNASYLDGTTNKAFSYFLNTGGAAAIGSGTVIPYAPKAVVNAGLEYAFDAFDGTLTPRVQYQFQDSQFILITHAAVPGPDNVIPAHGTLDFHLTYESPKNWLIEAYVLNLTNSTYLAGVNQNPQPAANWLMYGPPLEFGARLQYQF